MNELLKINALCKSFPVGKHTLKAVDNVSLRIKKGETLGLVGESGSGKSTLGRSILRLIEPDSGEIIFNDVNIRSLAREELRKQRRNMQIVFQDPLASLNPQMSIGAAILDPLEIHGIGTHKERVAKVMEMLDTVGVGRKFTNSFPYEFSGGQQQRIGIARALILNPQFIVCDEPVSALDVSIQAQIIALLIDLRKKFSLSYLFISHDLAVIRYISDYIAVMYLGRIVETGKKEDVFKNPLHPYTQAIINCAPRIPWDGNCKKKYDVLSGEIPSPIDLPQGCRFKTRCPWVTQQCNHKEPDLVDYGNGHMGACLMIKQKSKIPVDSAIIH